MYNLYAHKDSSFKYELNVSKNINDKISEIYLNIKLFFNQVDYITNQKEF